MRSSIRRCPREMLSRNFSKGLLHNKRDKNGCQFEASYFMNSDENGGIFSSYIALTKR